VSTRDTIDPIPALERLATAAHEFAELLQKRDLHAELTAADAERVTGFFRQLAAAARELEAWEHQLEQLQ